MKQKLIHTAVRGAVKLMRAKVRDVAFGFRMGAGFAGDINRSHPVNVEPCQQSATAPATAYGQAVVADTIGATNTIRPIVAADQAITTIYGVTTRPFPQQQSTSSVAYAASPFGAGTPPGAGEVIDVVRAGYIMVQLNTGEPSPTKGAPVYVCAEATNGNHVQGGFEVTARGAVTQVILDSRYTYNGPADADGVVELCCNV